MSQQLKTPHHYSNAVGWFSPPIRGVDIAQEAKYPDVLSSSIPYAAVVKMASIMEGPLSKWTNVMKGWQYRWFVLDYNAGLLSYYTVGSSERSVTFQRV